MVSLIGAPPTQVPKSEMQHQAEINTVQKTLALAKATVTNLTSDVGGRVTALGTTISDLASAVSPGSDVQHIQYRVDEAEQFWMRLAASLSENLALGAEAKRQKSLVFELDRLTTEIARLTAEIQRLMGELEAAAQREETLQAEKEVPAAELEELRTTPTPESSAVRWPTRPTMPRLPRRASRL